MNYVLKMHIHNIGLTRLTERIKFGSITNLFLAKRLVQPKLFYLVPV